MNDDDRDLVIDLAGSSYLSSGGLRIFNSLKRETKRRNGRFALAAVGDYPRKVLEMAGFTKVLDMYPTVEKAVSDIVRRSKNLTLFNEIFYKKIEENGVKLTIEPGWMTTPPVLRVTGDLEKVLHATITESEIRAKKILRDHLLARAWGTRR